MIAVMAKTTKSKLAATITRGRVAAGSMPKLLEALGEPEISKRTIEKWESGERVPPDYVADGIIERIEKYLKK